MNTVLRVPHGYLRRHLSSVERVLVAAGLAILLYQLLTFFPAYPSPWEVVLTTMIFVVMLWSPPVAYFLAVFAAVYPLYTVSLYLAVLFLVVALLGQRVFIHNLGATLLVLLAPWLAQFQLAWLAPLLGGLWWGKSGGAWVGALSALWSQVLFGMTGLPPDLLAALGTAPVTSTLVTRFGPANSLETLQLLVGPLAPTPTLLLYHLLQITLWAMVAALVGGLAERRWVQQNHPIRVTVVLFAGALALLCGQIGLAAWLEQYAGDRLLGMAPQLVLAMLATTVSAAALDGIRDFAEHPFPARQTVSSPSEHAPDHPARNVSRLFQKIGRRGQPAQQAEAARIQAESYPPMKVPTNLPRREGKKETQDDIIKIELD